MQTHRLRKQWQLARGRGKAQTHTQTDVPPLKKPDCITCKLVQANLIANYLLFMVDATKFGVTNLAEGGRASWTRASWKRAQRLPWEQQIKAWGRQHHWQREQSHAVETMVEWWQLWQNCDNLTWENKRVDGGKKGGQAGGGLALTTAADREEDVGSLCLNRSNWLICHRFKEEEVPNRDGR